MKRWFRRFRQPESLIDPYDPSTAWMGLFAAILIGFVFVAFLVAIGVAVAASFTPAPLGG